MNNINVINKGLQMFINQLYYKETMETIEIPIQNLIAGLFVCFVAGILTMLVLINLNLI